MRHVFVSALCTSALGSVLLSGCSGGGGGSSPVTLAATPPPAILIAGSVRHSIGTETLVRTYASPSPTTPNFSAAYTIAQTATVSAAPQGAPGAFDLNTVANYTATQAPLTGEETTTVTTDAYENQIVTGASIVIQNAGSKTVTVGDDVSAAANGGPYVETANAVSLYSIPQTVGTYPLVTGTSYAQPMARTVSTTTTIANAAGALPAATFATSESQTYNSDGTHAFSLNLSDGDTQHITESANGTATLSEAGPVQTLQETIAQPTNHGTGNVIPVTIVRQTAAQPAPSSKTYDALDWYPGGGQPALPFDVIDVSVKGPVSSLPGPCAGAGSFPAIVEVDQTERALSLLGTYATTVQQRFDSNGLAVCRLTTITTVDYSIETGLQTAQTVQQTNLVLQSVGTAASSRATSAKPRS